MHELGIAMRIVDIVSNVAKANEVKAIDAIHLDIGELTGIVPDALLFSFEAAARDTCMANAQLMMNIIPGKARCNQCQTVFSPEHFFTVCSECGSTDCDIINGKELCVQSIIPANHLIKPAIP
jgi:hydrogenase nickel incorporation protein HypA/HybF